MNATICIGNTDDKLTQMEWANYVEAVSLLITISNYDIYFAGFSNPTKPWQNACWVINVGDDELYLKKQLSIIARRFRQDSIAVILGTTEFVKPEV